MKEKVGILGGAFNPPHRAHLVLAEAAVHQLSLKKLIFVPAKDPPHKKIEGNWDFNTRSLMIKTAAFCITPDQLSQVLEKYSGNEKKNFLKEYEELYLTNFRPEFTVSDMEESRSGKSYTIDTVKTILEQNPGWIIHVIIGMDQAAVFDTWKNWEELSRISVICAADRMDYSREEVKKKFPFIQILDFPKMDMSSTDLRNNLSKGFEKTEVLPNILIRLISIISKDS